MSCTITRKKEHRKIIEEEFRRQKGDAPFKNWRQMAKSINFLMIFGGSGSVLSKSALELDWTEENIDEYISQNHIEDYVANFKGHENESALIRKYIAVASHMREEFFKNYPCLKMRLDREKKYAAEHGYCRTVFGAKRNLIELMLRGSYDDKNMARILRNLENIAANVRCQNMEACIRGRAQYECQQWFEKRGMQSRTWNEIHDSADFWIARSELHDALAHIKHTFERIVPELADNWIPLNCDCEVSDRLKGDCYKGGHNPSAFGVEWRDLEYEDPDPFGVELSPELEKNYFIEREEHFKKKGEKDPQEDEIKEYLKNKALD